LAHGIPSKFATQQLLIYPPHQRIAATLPWERVDCTVHIVVTLATKVIITVAQNNKDIQLVHTGALESKYHSKCSTGLSFINSTVDNALQRASIKRCRRSATFSTGI